MSETVSFRCNNCGYRFETQVLTEREKREAADERRSTSAVHCPKCYRTDVRRGWE